MQPRIYDSSSNLVMLFLLIAATAAPERGLLFASTGAKPNGCAGHGPPESSKCGAGKENWVCKPTPKPQAPDCRECSDPFVEGIDSACDSDSSGRGNYTQFNYDCPITRVVTYPPECCHLGGAFVVEELHTAVTALLGTPGLESFCSTPGVCKEWANGTGFGTSSNGFAYGIKYTEIGGPNDGQDGCLINREVLNDEVCPPPLTLPTLPVLSRWQRVSQRAGVAVHVASVFAARHQPRVAMFVRLDLVCGNTRGRVRFLPRRRKWRKWRTW